MLLDNTLAVFKCQTENKSEISKIAWKQVFKALQSIYGENADLNIAKSEKGKPYFKAYPDFHFNISHSGSAFAIAFSKYPVGADIEKIRPVNPKIPEKFFTEKEQKFIKKETDFFYVWTRKEAYIKRSGKGFSHSLSSFDVLNAEDIKTFNLSEFTVSVCSEFANNFKLLENTLEI